MIATSLIRRGTVPLLDVLGPTVEILTPGDAETGYCVMQGSLPPGVPVPLHSHPDDESFLLLAGVTEVLVQDDGQFTWHRLEPGDFVHIPGNVKHAWRNPGDEPAAALIVTTAKLGRFFREIGRAVDPTAASAPPPADAVARFTEASLARGHWLGSPEENASVGITLPF